MEMYGDVEGPIWLSIKSRASQFQVYTVDGGRNPVITS